MNIMLILAIFTLIFSFVVALAVVVVGPNEQGALGASVFKRREKPAVIGYKKAMLVLGRGSFPLQGVVGYGYAFVDERGSGPGFHMYSNIHEAESHPQEGNVILEVLGYGNVNRYDLGYITEKQRVLQVIAGDCAHCRKQSEYFNTTSLKFVCRDHRARGKCMGLSQLQTSVRSYNGAASVVVAPRVESPRYHGAKLSDPAALTAVEEHSSA